MARATATAPPTNPARRCAYVPATASSPTTTTACFPSASAVSAPSPAARLLLPRLDRGILGGHSPPRRHLAFAPLVSPVDRLSDLCVPRGDGGRSHGQQALSNHVLTGCRQPL